MKFLNAATFTTILRYGLQALGGILVANGRLDAGQWETVSGAVLVILPALLGVFAANTDKVVMNGKAAPVDALPSAAKDAVTKVTQSKPKRLTFIEQLFGAVLGRKGL